MLKCSTFFKKWGLYINSLLCDINIPAKTLVVSNKKQTLTRCACASEDKIYSSVFVCLCV